MNRLQRAGKAGMSKLPAKIQAAIDSARHGEEFDNDAGREMSEQETKSLDRLADEIAEQAVDDAMSS